MIETLYHILNFDIAVWFRSLQVGTSGISSIRIALRKYLRCSSDESYGKLTVALQGLLAEPDNTTGGRLIDVAHRRHLACLLDIILLIDAYCVDP